MKKIILTILVVIIFFNICSVYATSGPSDPSGGSVVSAVSNTVPKLWGVVITGVQVIAIGCVVFAGLRYMFAPAGQRADIKKNMIYLIIGSMLIFGAVTIIQAVASII